MKKLMIGLVCGAVLGAGVSYVSLQVQSAKSPAAGAAGETGSPAASPAKPETNPLKLNAAKRSAAGIVLARPIEQTLERRFHAYARVLDPTPLITLVSEIETAEAAVQASGRDLERLQTLHASANNVSTQALEAAEATARRDRSALVSARQRLRAGWGATIAEMKDLGSFTQDLLKESVLLRVDLLAGDHPAIQPTKVLLTMPDGLAVESGVLDCITSTDTQLQGTGYLVRLDKARLPAGYALKAEVSTGTGSRDALLAPRSAVVYHQGSAWVYVLGEEDTFERRLVTVDLAKNDLVSIEGNLDKDVQLVTTGAQQLLAAELQAGESQEEP